MRPRTELGHGPQVSPFRGRQAVEANPEETLVTPSACAGFSVTSLGPTRSQLIAKGMVWSPSHGDTDFTVPLFHQFMRRVMPDDWRL